MYQHMFPPTSPVTYVNKEFLWRATQLETSECGTTTRLLPDGVSKSDCLVARELDRTCSKLSSYVWTSVAEFSNCDVISPSVAAFSNCDVISTSVSAFSNCHNIRDSLYS